jgi:ribosomal protein S18 acetylase RimI-like enzyme
MLPATGEGSYLRQQFPQVYGFLGGLAGTAPDEMQGSAMDPNTAAVRQGASYGYLPGLVASSAPLGKVGAGMGMLAGMARGTQKFDNSALMAKKFDVVKRDASEIFGAGAERFRYTDPASGGMIDVLKRPDNTASVLGLEVPEAFRGKGIGESLQSQVLQDFPAMMGQVSSKAAAKTAYRLGRRPPNQPNASLDDVFKLMDENSSVNLVSPKMQQTFNPAPSSTFDNSVLTGAKFVAPKEAKAIEIEAYKGTHRSPSPEFGAPLHDLTGGGQMYPADVYSAKAAQYYGTGYPKADRDAFALAQRVRGNPDAEVTMYRAVPKDENIKNINLGDWVTLSKDYAKTHGESVLENNYKILSQKVKAKDLWTNADSIHEFGYHPQNTAATSVQFDNSALMK